MDGQPGAPEPVAVAPRPTQAELEAQLADAERRAYWATMRVGELQGEIQRMHQARRIAIGAVVAVALLAILMLGIVAFKAIDASADSDDSEPGVASTNAA